MADRSVGVGTKRRRHYEKDYQNKERAYSRKKGLDYNTGDYTLKKTKGIDELQGEHKENRGRKKGDAPRGKKKGTGKGHK